MNSKRKGSRNEHRTMKLLEAAGYSCTRAAASLGVFDIIGIGSADILLVQVKSNTWPALWEIENIKAFRAPSNTRKLIHRWRDRVKLPDVKEI